MHFTWWNFLLSFAIRSLLPYLFLQLQRTPVLQIMPAPFPLLQRNSQLSQMAKERLYLCKHLAKLPRDSWVSLNTRLFSDPLLSYVSQALSVPTGGYHPLVPTCSIWINAKVQLLHHYSCNRQSYCLVLNAKLREKRRMTLHSKQLDHTFKTICAKLPWVVRMIHLCTLFPNVTTVLGLIYKDSQTVLQLSSPTGAEEKLKEIRLIIHWDWAHSSCH